MLPAEVLCHLLGWKFCLTDIAKVSRQVDCLTLHQAGQQGHIGCLPPACRQRHSKLVQFVPQELATILGLGASENTAKEGGIEALWWREPPLDLSNGHLVLGGGGEEGEAARSRTEDVGGQHRGHAVVEVVILLGVRVPEEEAGG